jgi:hypothetical protein
LLLPVEKNILFYKFVSIGEVLAKIFGVCPILTDRFSKVFLGIGVSVISHGGCFGLIVIPELVVPVILDV